LTVLGRIFVRFIQAAAAPHTPSHPRTAGRRITPILKGAKDPEAAKRLIAFLASEKATPAVEKTGMKRTQLR